MKVLEVKGLEKRYGAAVALAGVDFELGEREIHALLGENGAGKSTLIKALAGIIKPDHGDIVVGGQKRAASATSRDAASAGFRFVHQDLGLVDSMSVLDNVALEIGYMKTSIGLIDFAATGAIVRERLLALGCFLAPDRLVGDLTQAEKVIVAIARAMVSKARVLVLDEVTASLPAPEAARLHGAIRAARDQGLSVVFVTHRIEEIFGLCDRLTVLGDGRRVATASVSDVDHATVVRWIVGRDLTRSARTAHQPRGPTTARLAVDGLLAHGLSTPLTFSVAPGEVLGITGLVGSGYDVVARLLAGVEPATEGCLRLDGATLPFGSAPALRKAGFQVVTGDRSQGAFHTLAVRENIFAERVHGRGPGLADERARSAALVKAFNVHPLNCAESLISTLSGGNQQKVLFARAVENGPRALLLIDPTAGVDIGARGELYAILKRETERGLAVVLASSDFEEIESQADRALVLSKGRLAAVVERDELTQSRLVYEALEGATPGFAKESNS